MPGQGVVAIRMPAWVLEQERNPARRLPCRFGNAVGADDRELLVIGLALRAKFFQIFEIRT